MKLLLFDPTQRPGDHVQTHASPRVQRVGAAAASAR